MKAIMAMDSDRGVGLNGGIPWRVVEDFKWFKEFTMGKSIVIGKKTFDTLPKLPGRNVYFLSDPKTKNPHEIPIGDMGIYVNVNGLVARRLLYANFVTHGLITVDLFGNETTHRIEDLIIAGGRHTYESFLPYITEFYVTHINGKYDCDTFMLPFEHLFKYQEVVRTFGEHKVIKYVK